MSLGIVVEMIGEKKRKRRGAKLADRSTEPKAAANPRKDPAWVKSIDVCGQRYRVGVFTDERGYQGATTFADNAIEIQDQAEDRMHDTLLHELLHACFDACGLKLQIRERFSTMKKKDRDFLEEAICVMLSPALLATLRRAGWLKLPRKPGPRVVHKAAASQAR
jgi:hypothetical protein